MNHSVYTLYTDGASRGNPGQAGIGAVLYDGEGHVAATRKAYIGRKTNNEAEYYALITGLEEARNHPCEKLCIFLDSELLVRQITGVYRIKSPSLKPLFMRVKELLSTFPSYEISHVRREKNTVADGLANEAIDDEIGSS